MNKEDTDKPTHALKNVRSIPYVGDINFTWIAECVCGWYSIAKHTELSATKALNQHITAKTQNQ